MVKAAKNRRDMKSDQKTRVKRPKEEKCYGWEAFTVSPWVGIHGYVQAGDIFHCEPVRWHSLVNKLTDNLKAIPLVPTYAFLSPSKG